MKIRSLTFLATVLFSQFAFADLTASNTTDICNALEGRWHGKGQGEAIGLACSYDGYVTVKQDGPGKFMIIDSAVNKVSPSKLLCPPSIALKEAKGTCDKGVLHVQAETKAKDGQNSTIELRGSLEGEKSAKLKGSMAIGGTNINAEIKEFNLDKQ